MHMNLTPPRPMVFYVAVIPAVLALAGRIIALPLITPYSFGLLPIGFIILALGVLIRDW